MKQVYDEIRRQWVAATPEEVVRQKWILRMVRELSFPKELLVVERELRALPHLERHPYPLPNRRIDLLSFEKGSSPAPLLLIECKAQSLTDEMLEQALAYNTFVQAPYVAIVNQSEVRLRYHLMANSSPSEIDRLPSFKELLAARYE